MSHVETSIQGHIPDIQIRRVEKFNALSLEMYHDLCRALAELDNNPQLRVAVLHAEGKHFTAGVELDEWASHFGSGQGFPQQMGWANSQRYLLTGECWSATEAYRLGLVQEVVPPGQQYEAAMEVAEGIQSFVERHEAVFKGC